MKLADINSFIVSPEEPFFEVLRRINDNDVKIVFVCDENRVLLGAINDGDIRRFLLNKSDLNQTALDIAFKNPRYINEKELCNVNNFIKGYQLNVIPVVNDNKQVKDIIIFNGISSLNKVAKKFTREIPVVIMAGGKGTRLAPITDILPKPLVSVNGKPIIDYIMRCFEYFGSKEFHFIVNYKKEFIKAYFNDSDHNISFHEEEDYLGTGGGLSLLKDIISSTFFVSNCDILIDCDYTAILEAHQEQGNIITVICAEKEVVIPYGVLEVEGGKTVKALTEKPKFDFLVNTGVYICEADFLQYIPDNTFIHITDVIQQLIGEGKKVGVYKVKEEEWMDMGTMDELYKMQNRLQGLN